MTNRKHLLFSIGGTTIDFHIVVIILFIKLEMPVDSILCLFDETLNKEMITDFFDRNLHVHW